MTDIRITKIRAIPIAKQKSVINSLSPAARERLCKKREPHLRLSSIAAYSLLTNEERADLDFTPSGAPIFQNLDKCISVSHSKNYACVVVTDSKSERVGIDIEEKTTAPHSTTRFLTQNEQKMLADGTPYLEIWTKKEALFKFLKNDSLPLPAIDSATPEKYGATLETRETDEYHLAVCTEKDNSK